MSSRCKMCILVLCGLPGCGKTTFSSKLVENIVSNWCRSKVFHVCYDSLFPLYLERQTVASQLSKTDIGDENSKWKTYRRGIFNLVKESLHSNSSIPSSGEQEAENKLGCDIDSDLGHLRQKFIDYVLTPMRNNTETIEDLSDTIQVWIVDDNMYYSSMRYEYYQLARQFQIGFAEVYMKCALDYALTNNRCRPDETRVNDDVIVAMNEKIEPPNPGNHWENNCLVVEAEYACQHVHDVMKLIEDSIAQPVEALPQEDTVMKAESRKTCSKSILYQADQILRKLTATHMAKVKESGATKSVLQVAAKQVNSLKCDILDGMRQGDIAELLDIKEEENASKHEDSVLFKTIKSIFEEKIQT